MATIILSVFFSIQNCIFYSRLSNSRSSRCLITICYNIILISIGNVDEKKRYFISYLECLLLLYIPSYFTIN